MIRLRVGTRGSDLALRQTAWVCDRLRAAHASLDIERIIIQTHGDLSADRQPDADQPVGRFVGAVEEALTAERIDFAVHSYKDLQTVPTPGLIVAAVPTRGIEHDILVARAPVDLDNLPSGFTVGTGSPRRIAQFKRLGDVHVVPIRGNVSTRIAKIERDGLDGVVLAAAGIQRLGIALPNVIALPTDRFVPAPAQGALAVQTRTDGESARLISVLDDPGSRRRVDAERSFLRAIDAGCHTPAAALAILDPHAVSLSEPRPSGSGPSRHAPRCVPITLRGQLFSDDHARMVDGLESGTEPRDVGRRLAVRLLERLREMT